MVFRRLPREVFLGTFVLPNISEHLSYMETSHVVGFLGRLGFVGLFLETFSLCSFRKFSKVSEIIQFFLRMDFEWEWKGES